MLHLFYGMFVSILNVNFILLDLVFSLVIVYEHY